MMGNKQKVTIDLLCHLSNDLNNPDYQAPLGNSINIVDSYKLLLLGDIATSLAIMADESVKRNDMLIKLEGMNENEMEYVKSEKEKR